MRFNMKSIATVEFAVVLHGSEQPCYMVPVAPAVQSMLKEMLHQTDAAMGDLDKGEDIDYGEEYGSRTCVGCDIDDPTVSRVIELFNAQNIPSSAAALNDPSRIDFYFVRYTDNVGQRCLGVKTPSQFRASVGKKWISLLDDQLVPVEHKIFKLDNEFDFVVTSDRINILNPNQFMRVAEVDNVLAELAPRHISELASTIAIVDFDPVLDYAMNHKRAQKLISSIRKRNNLGKVTLARLKTACEQNGIKVEAKNGKLVPQPKCELDFLELLDGRRYTYPLDEQDPEKLRALRRSKV